MLMRSQGKKEKKEEEETRIDVTIPYCRFSLGSELFFVKMPNFLSIERKPFDPSMYEDEMEEDEVLDEEGRARLKLKVHFLYIAMQTCYAFLTISENISDMREYFACTSDCSLTYFQF